MGRSQRASSSTAARRADQIGFTQTAGLFTAGAQVALDDVWRLGAAGGYQSSTLQTATGAQSDGSLGARRRVAEVQSRARCCSPAP